MAHEFLDADVHGLFMLADLIDQYWRDPSKDLAGEIRLQRQSFGLTPLDRRRLQWEVERVEQAGRKRQQLPPPPAPEAGDDPRKLLRLV